MQINRVIVGNLDTNCYVIEKDNKCLVIDPGDEYDKIEKVIANNEVVGVIVTHYHFDHIGALDNFDKNLIFDINNLKEKEYNIDCFNFEVIYTPGHKEDAITIYFREENVMFTGDFIFKDAIGRVDLSGGNYVDMLNSLNKISKYDKGIKIYPGHGVETYLNKELTKF